MAGRRFVYIVNVICFGDADCRMSVRVVAYSFKECADFVLGGGREFAAIVGLGDFEVLSITRLPGGSVEQAGIAGLV